MESKLPLREEGQRASRSKMLNLLNKHYKTLAWVGFALWLLTMYAVLFQMDYLFS